LLRPVTLLLWNTAVTGLNQRWAYSVGALRGQAGGGEFIGADRKHPLSRLAVRS